MRMFDAMSKLFCMEICDNHVDDNGKMCVRTENPDNNGMLWAINTLCTILINKQRELDND